MSRVQKYFYSPSENNLGVVYSDWLGRERFVRFVTHSRWCWMRPFWFVFKEIGLNPRTAHLVLKNVFSSNNVPLDIELKVFYRVDPRLANQENILQVLKFPSDAFETIVKTNMQEKARNDVFIQYDSRVLFTYAGRQSLRKALSFAIAERVKGFGIIINPLYGVSIINLQPNQTYLKALQDQSAATALSEAAILRILPMLNELEMADPNVVAQLISTSIASAINKTGEVPNTLFTRMGEKHKENSITSIPLPMRLAEELVVGL